MHTDDVVVRWFRSNHSLFRLRHPRRSARFNERERERERSRFLVILKDYLVILKDSLGFPTDSMNA